MPEKVRHDTECEVFCIDTEKTSSATVLRFEYKKLLKLVNTEMEINMRYDAKRKLYVGHCLGDEYTTPGPKTHITP